MKRLLLVLALLTMAIQVEAATLNLRATWTANTEPDMKEYKLYRTDGTRVLLGTISHPTVSFSFPLTVPDNTEGTLSFVGTAIDTTGNESADSAPATYHYDKLAPGTMKTLIIIINLP